MSGAHVKTYIRRCKITCRIELDVCPGITENVVEFKSTFDRWGVRLQFNFFTSQQLHFTSNPVGYADSPSNSQLYNRCSCEDSPDSLTPLPPPLLLSWSELQIQNFIIILSTYVYNKRIRSNQLRCATAPVGCMHVTGACSKLVTPFYGY